MAKIGTLKNDHACVDTTCYWHTSHWGNKHLNGCYKFTDIDYCSDKGWESIKDGLKREYPEKYKELYGGK